jgi:sterol desaturase/sphingolipid hydroxylase (fatty acid hydroxylase superfamily)
MMASAQLAAFAQSYHWQLSLLAGAAIIAATLGGRVFRFVPAFAASHELNTATLRKRMERAGYADNQRWNRKWGAVYIVAIFALIVPFCLDAGVHPWWRILRDSVVILFVYDFFYYLMHRFVFHDSGFLGGPLVWMHAVHHRQHNPCRTDSSYIHPLESALGLGLFVTTIFALSFPLGRFDVVTFAFTWVAFTQINLHNHTLWETDRFPFRYMRYLSKMHHNHHARFNGGNFATISLLYDWMFGTLDNGGGLKPRGPQKASAAR